MITYFIARLLALEPVLTLSRKECGVWSELIGVLLMGVGVVGEYVGRIYEQVRQRPRYTIAALLEQEESQPHDVPAPRTVETTSGAGG